MIRFDCDYNEGAHPKVLELLLKTNMEQTAGYGEDPYCARASALIKGKCSREDADVHFLVGGTQTNLTLIAAALRPHQGAVAAATGHIHTHESGAVEATGHKVLTVPGIDGKITAEQIQTVCDEHFHDGAHEHIVQPKLVYLSNPTELGTIYSKTELRAISESCKRNALFLYADGARLGYALSAEGNDLELSDLALLCDAFSIGGTKGGALFGEALVLCNHSLKEDFRYIMKQKGGMLAKGRLLGLQFIALLEDDLYFEIAGHADRMATQIREACLAKGFGFLTHSTTNQQFPVLPNRALEQLAKDFAYSYWQNIDGERSAVRFCTSWATDLEDVKKLVAAIGNL